jgi:hypothetical protein
MQKHCGEQMELDSTDDNSYNVLWCVYWMNLNQAEFDLRNLSRMLIIYSD